MKKLCSLVDEIVFINSDVNISKWITIQSIVPNKKFIRISNSVSIQDVVNSYSKTHKKVMIITDKSELSIGNNNLKVDSRCVQCYGTKINYNTTMLSELDGKFVYVFNSAKLNYDFMNRYDFDIAVVISSYNRYEHLVSVINQINSQKTKYTYKIFVHDDGSTDERYRNLDSCVDVIRSESNGGKHHYWKSITKLFSETSKYNYKILIQVDDDFILCNNFVDEIVKIYNNNNPCAIHYHINTESSDKNRWGMSSWLDGGSCFKRSFLEIISFKVQEIPMKRWLKDPTLSSGVWHQISQTLEKLGCVIYKPNFTLAVHNGNDCSMMNADLRKRVKINSKW